MINATAKVATDPTERSKPSTVSETVMPVAMTVTMEMLRMMVTMFDAVRKEGMVTEKKISKTKMVMMVPHLLKNATGPAYQACFWVVSVADVMDY